MIGGLLARETALELTRDTGGGKKRCDLFLHRDLPSHSFDSSGLRSRSFPPSTATVAFVSVLAYFLSSCLLVPHALVSSYDTLRRERGLRQAGGRVGQGARCHDEEQLQRDLQTGQDWPGAGAHEANPG